MTPQSDLTRRTALTTLAGTALTAIAGCLDDNSSETPEVSSTTRSNEPLSAGVMDDGRLVVNIADRLDVNRVNLIQPNGELYGQRDVAAGVTQVTFELGTTYQPGDYSILARNGEQTTAETTLNVEPDLQITEVGLYRNHPDKPWDEVYGESETNRVRNGEAFVTVTNAGSGPDAAVEMSFTGDVPNPIEDPRGSGLYDTEKVTIPAGESVDLYSMSFPFGSETADGMGCAPNGNTGRFKVRIETVVSPDSLTKSFRVEYSGSEDMTDCKIQISGV